MADGLDGAIPLQGEPPSTAEPPGASSAVAPKKSAPGQVLLATVGLSSAVGLGVLLGNALHHAVVTPFLYSGVTDQSGYGVFFSVPRLVGFVVPLLLVMVVLIVGSVGIFRYRTSPVTAKGARAGALTRWSARMTALLVMAAALFIIEPGATALLRHTSSSTPSQPPTVVLIIVGCGCIGLLVLAVRTLRSASFQFGRMATIVGIVALIGLLALPFGASLSHGQAAYFVDTGFRGYGPEPDPLFTYVKQVACGDRAHCVVDGAVTGIPGGPQWGIAATADGGSTWRTIRLGLHWPWIGATLGTLSCRANQCWGIAKLVGLVKTSSFVATITVESDGRPQVQFHPLPPPVSPLFGSTPSNESPSASTCTSSSHCLTLTSAYTTVVNEPGVNRLVASVTTDGGGEWTSTLVPVPSDTFAVPPFLPSAGPQCDPAGTCALVVTLASSSCKAVCPEWIGVLRSTDGGQTWNSSQLGATLTDVFGLDASCQGIPVCSVNTTPQRGQTTYIVSTDGGASWSSPVSLDGQGVVKCSTTGECMGGVGGRIEASFNGGRTWMWSPVRQPPQTSGVVGCSADGRCLLGYGTRTGVDVLTVDRPDVWTLRSIPVPILIAPSITGSAASR